MFDKMQTRLKLEFNKKKNNKLLQKKKIVMQARFINNMINTRSISI